eukprot:TRINITY_DN921_c0_g1_i1.p1 TRINITY_DN921_c0_g1~~TRINITY_DN921_c0_g1_i1.p1  ORF type:complete len:981 (+),score=220.64 TRINITY_DN921_c0_g1_i1:69-3011(+)
MLSLPPTHQKRHRSARRNRAPAPPVHFRCVIVTRLGKCLLNTGLSPAMRNLFEEGSPVEKTRNSDAKIIVTKQFCRLIAGFAQLADERRQVYFATASCGVEMFVADYVIVAIFSPVDKLRESAQQRAMQIYDALATAHGADVMAAASDDQAEYEEGSHAYTPQSATKDDDTIDSEVVTERVYRDFESSFVRAVLADTSTLPSSPARDVTPPMQRRMSSVRRQSTPPRERDVASVSVSAPASASVTADTRARDTSPSMQHRISSVRRQSTPTRDGESTNIVLAMARDQTDQTPQQPAKARDETPQQQPAMARDETPQQPAFAARDETPQQPAFAARDQTPQQPAMARDETPQQQQPAMARDQSPPPSMARRQSSVRRHTTPTRQEERGDSVAATPAREVSPPMTRRVSSVRRQSATPTREERAPLPPRDGSPSMSRRQSSVRRQSTPTRGDAGRDQSAGRSEDAERNLSPSMMQRRASVRRQSTPTRDGRDVSPAMARRISSVRRQTTPLRSDDGELIPAPPSMARDVRDASPSMARRVSSVRRQSTPTRASVASTNSSSDQLFRLPPLPTASAASQRNDTPPMTRRTVSVRRQSASLRDAAAVDQVPERQPQQQHQQQQERIPLPKTLPPLNVPQSDSVPTSTTATQNHVTSPKDVSLPMELPISLDELRPHKPHLPAQSPISVSRSPATTHSSASRKLFGDESLVSRTAVTAPVAETPQRVAVVDSAANDSVELSPMEESFGSPDGLSLATTGELYDGVFTIQPSPVPKHREFRSFIVPPTPSLRDAAVRLPSRSKQPVVSVVSDSGSDFADDAPSVAQQSRFVRRRSLREATSVPAAIKPAPPASEPPPSMAALRSRQLAQLMSSGANLPTLSPAAAAVPVDTPPGSPMMISPAPPPRSSISPKRVGFNAGYSPARFDMKSAVPESQQPFASPLIQRSPSPESKALMFTSVAFQATPTSAPRRKSVVALSSEQQVRVS